MKTEHPFLTSPKTHAAASLALTLVLVLLVYLAAESYLGHPLSAGPAVMIVFFGARFTKRFERFLNSQFKVKPTDSLW